MRNFVRNPNADNDLIHNLFGVKMLINVAGQRRMAMGERKPTTRSGLNG